MTPFGHMKEKHHIHNTKTVRITNALSETMHISFNETVRFDNCYIFKTHAVEPGLSLNLHYSVLELYLQHCSHYYQYGEGWGEEGSRREGKALLTFPWNNMTDFICFF